MQKANIKIFRRKLKRTSFQFRKRWISSPPPPPSPLLPLLLPTRGSSLMWDLSSQVRDWTRATEMTALNPNLPSSGELPRWSLPPSLLPPFLSSFLPSFLPLLLSSPLPSLLAFPPLSLFFMAAPVAYESSQARGPMRATAVIYTTATAARDPSHICDLCCSLKQYRILNPLIEAGD